MNCFECVNSFLKKSGLKFNEQKSVLLYFMPEKLRVKPGTSVMMNDTAIKMESSCRYLGHMITDGLHDNEDIKRQLSSVYGKANMLLHAAYNNVFMRLMGYHKFCSASGMFLEKGLTILMLE